MQNTDPPTIPTKDSANPPQKPYRYPLPTIRKNCPGNPTVMMTARISDISTGVAGLEWAWIHSMRALKILVKPWRVCRCVLDEDFSEQTNERKTHISAGYGTAKHIRPRLAAAPWHEIETVCVCET